MPENCPKKTPEKPQRVRLSTARTDIENAFDRLHVMLDMVGLPTKSVAESKARVMAYLDQRERDDTRERAALIACQTLVDADAEEDIDIFVSKASDAAEQARAALADD